MWLCAGRYGVQISCRCVCRGVAPIGGKCVARRERVGWQVVKRCGVVEIRVTLGVGLMRFGGSLCIRRVCACGRVCCAVHRATKVHIVFMC